MKQARVSFHGWILGARPWRARIASTATLRFTLASFALASSTFGGGGTTTLVSVSSSGAQATADSNGEAISGDGRFVAFASSATNLDPSVTIYPNNERNLFLHDRLTGTTKLVSVSTTNPAQAANGHSSPRSLSYDGRYVSFQSSASDLPLTGVVTSDTNGFEDAFVYDRVSDTTVLISTDDNGVQGNSHSGQVWLSADGRFVAFDSSATNLVPSAPNGCYVHDRDYDGTGVGNGIFDEVGGFHTVKVDVSTLGMQANNSSEDVSISADGLFVAFTSLATNLLDNQPITSGRHQIYRRDLVLGTTELMSVNTSGVEGNGGADHSSITADGRFVEFDSTSSDLVNNDNNGASDVFVRDHTLGTTSMVSVDTFGVVSNGPNSGLGRMSSDGRYVAFGSTSTNLVVCDTNGTADVFLRDRDVDANGVFDQNSASLTMRVSISSSGLEANGGSTMSAHAQLSANGRYVVFQSLATNLVPNDLNGFEDVFVYDRGLAETVLYCTAKTNSQGCVPTMGCSGTPSLSGPDDFHVTASNVLNNKLGIMFWGTAPACAPFFGGMRCVHSPIIRTPSQHSGGSPPCLAGYDFYFSHAYMASHLIPAYQTLYAQYWSRDPGFPIPNNVGVTNALMFVIDP